MNREDTIAAISTAQGEGGIGIIRISGEMAEAILRSIFIPVKIDKRKSEMPDSESDFDSVDRRKNLFLPEATSMTIGGEILNRRMTYGFIQDPETDEMIDEVLAVFMKGPHTYTTEDIVEIDCHGSMISLKKILSLVLHQGARIAEPGEFTKRAFLNGRIDLSQAEAVIDVIKAKTEYGYQAAFQQLSGKLSRAVKEIREDLVEILVNLAVNIDYPDEDIEEISYEVLNGDLRQVKGKLEKLYDTRETGRILREGLKTVIVGKPNVGKSSLMNLLLKENRSIVTDIPGTTRDTIEEQLNIGGIYLNIIDTAGIRETEDQVERIGVDRSREAFQKADLILFLLDGSKPLSEEDEKIMKEINGKPTIVLLNKMDQKRILEKESIRIRLPEYQIIETSMKEERGIEELEKEIERVVFNENIQHEENALVTNVRHGALMKEAICSLEDALVSVERREALEVLEIDVRQAWERLGEIIGETVQEDLISEIFSRFCLGK